MQEIEEATIKVIAGPEKKSHVVTEQEQPPDGLPRGRPRHRDRLLSASTSDPVHQITIIPRGGAGGYTMYLPEKDPSYVTKTAMFENIVTLLGGRVAEQLVSGGHLHRCIQRPGAGHQDCPRHGYPLWLL